MDFAIDETAAYREAKRKRRVLLDRFMIVPVNLNEPPPQQYKSLLWHLQHTGQVRLTKPMQMLRARKLYCIKLQDKRDVAKEIKVPLDIIDGWITQFGWDELRQKREFEIYQGVAGIRKKVLPNINEKHDLMFHNLESLIEDTVYRVKRSQGTDKEIMLAPKDIATLATAAKTCMDQRRIIHSKEGKISKHVLELQDGTMLAQFQEMLTGAMDIEKKLAPPKEVEEIKQIPTRVVMDAEFEDDKDDDNP